MCRFVQDKFGGRDYRRGAQYNTQMRYSNNSMKPPGSIRNYTTNQPNFYNQVSPRCPADSETLKSCK